MQSTVRTHAGSESFDLFYNSVFIQFQQKRSRLPFFRALLDQEMIVAQSCNLRQMRNRDNLSNIRYQSELFRYDLSDLSADPCVHLIKDQSADAVQASRDDLQSEHKARHFTTGYDFRKFAQRTTRRGVQVFYTTDASQALAESLQKHLNQKMNVPTLGRGFEPIRGDYYIADNGDIPSVIVECAFLSSPIDEALIIDPDYRLRLAAEIESAVANYIQSAQLS